MQFHVSNPTSPEPQKSVITYSPKTETKDAQTNFAKRRRRLRCFACD